MSLALARAAHLLRLPTAPEEAPELVEGVGLRCPRTGRVYPLRDGVLDLLGGDFRPTPAQRALDTRASAWLYDQLRERLAFVFSMPSFPEEAEDVVDRLAVGPGDVVLDLACGHGNFTAALADRVGPEGLVIGLDIAASMLRRAASRRAARGLGQVLLVRGDALALPFADGCLAKINCSGGLHQIPDLPRALAEIARVGGPGARLAASGFAVESERAVTAFQRFGRRHFGMHFVDLEWLREELGRAGFESAETRMPASRIGYCWGVLGAGGTAA